VQKSERVLKGHALAFENSWLEHTGEGNRIQGSFFMLFVFLLIKLKSLKGQFTLKLIFDMF